MVHRLCILCFLVALWPGLALAQSAALDNAYNQYKALFEQGRYAEAEPFARKTLELGQLEFGPDHSNTGTFLNNLAELYRAQGRYAEAEPLYRRSLATNEKALGPEHPDFATSLNNLAELYRAQGRYAKAEPLHKRALAIREKAATKATKICASMRWSSWWLIGRMARSPLSSLKACSISVSWM